MWRVLVCQRQAYHAAADAGGLLGEELRKRNTYLLYAVAASNEQQQQQQHVAVLGYLIMQVNSVTAHINKLAVALHARCQGIGAALLRVSASCCYALRMHAHGQH